MKAVVCTMLMLLACCQSARVGTGGKFCSQECYSTGDLCVYTGAKSDGTITFRCDCKSGFKSNDDGTACVDVEECAEKIDNCDTHAKCTNTDGGFTCECLSGYKDTDTDGKPGIACDQIDECAEKTDSCNTTISVCHDTDGSYRCDCSSGFQNVAGNLRICENVDECQDDSMNNCTESTECEDSWGTYSCKCKDGYVADPDTQYACKDYDQCAAAAFDLCDTSRSVCHDMVGDYECDCLDGYEHYTDASTSKRYNKQCVDVDECESKDENECDKFAHCINTVGSYKCDCFYGYTGDGMNCTEVGTTLKELEDMVKNLSHTRITLMMQHAYYEELALHTQLEALKRNCDQHIGGVHDNHKHLDDSRKKRAVMHSLSDRQLALSALMHHNDALKLQIEILKKSCGIKLLKHD